MTLHLKLNEKPQSLCVCVCVYGVCIRVYVCVRNIQATYFFGEITLVTVVMKVTYQTQPEVQYVELQDRWNGPYFFS